MSRALVVNLVLLSIFAVQHSVMARPQFKRWWIKFVPASVERTTYVLLASLALALLIWQWRSTPTIVWQIANPQLAAVVTGLSFLGWLIVLTSTFLINHFARRRQRPAGQIAGHLVQDRASVDLTLLVGVRSQ